MGRCDDGLSAPGDVSKDRRHILISPRGHATLPFKIEKSLGTSENGTKSYEVNFSDYCQYQYAESILAPRDRDSAYDASNGAWDSEGGYSAWRDGQRLHLNGKQGTAIRSNRGDVWVPGRQDSARFGC